MIQCNYIFPHHLLLGYTGLNSYTDFPLPAVRTVRIHTNSTYSAHTCHCHAILMHISVAMHNVFIHVRIFIYMFN